MVIESPPPALDAAQKKIRRQRLLQRHGFFRTLNKLLLNWYRSRFTAAKDALTIRSYLFPNGTSVRYARPVASVSVPSINDPECIRFIENLKPDLLAVCGTTVIKPEVFTLAPMGAINIHTGITPEYRSADPIFWALYRNEPHKVGVTIHFVDRGIDTGAIIHQECVPLYAEDTMTTIYVRCISVGARLYLQTLDEIALGTVKIMSRSGVVGKAFYSINLGIVQHLIFLMRFNRLKTRLPKEGLASTLKEANR